MEVKISECNLDILCVECKKETCTRHGNPGADCPKWKCDNLTGDCDNCAFLKNYQEEERKYYMQEMKEKIKTIADHYGYEPQSRQLIEEMAELTQAINKLWRKQGNGQSTEKSVLACRDNMVEEIADVEIMLEQIKHLMDCETDVMYVKTVKVNRQLERIKQEETK